MNTRFSCRNFAAITLLPVAALPSFALAKPTRCLTETTLSNTLLNSVRQVDFDQVIDLGPNFTEDSCPANEPACKHGRSAIGRSKFPQIDLAVIAFQPDCPDRVIGGNVVFSRDFPTGIAAKFDTKTGGVNNLRMQRWTQERFDEGRPLKEKPYFENKPGAWQSAFPSEDLINAEARPGATNFMSPYPASVFKILVLARVLQYLEDNGPLESQLEQKYTYDFGTPETSDDVTLTIREFLDAMIQWSGNKATAAMIQFLHRNGQIVESELKDDAGYPKAPPSFNSLNAMFAELGLGSLQMNRTRAKDGLWGNRDTMYLKDSSSVSHISMPSWDVARFLWLMRTNRGTSAAEIPSWLTATGRKVDPFKISDKVKDYFWANMSDQLFHEVLSNTLHCKQQLGGPLGIPALLSGKWIDNEKLKLPAGNFPFPFPADELKGDYAFSPKINECQREAEVTFASKTGLTSVSGSHAGLVKGLSERGFKREYIVVLNSSLGSRFTDIERLDSERVIPCFDKTLCYTRRINQLGGLIDNSLKGWLEHDERNAQSTKTSRRATKVR